MKKIILIVLFILLPSVVFAGYTSCGPNCYLADTASSADVQAALDAANATSGGTVKIPTGEETWTSGVYIHDPTYDLVIQGNGIDNTKITNGRSPQTNLFTFRVSGTVSFTIKDMTIITSSGSSPNPTLFIYGASPNKRVTNIYFDMTGINGGRMFQFGSNSDAIQGAGVIDNCTFYNPTGTAQAISIAGNAAGDSYYWTGNPTFGTANAYYIEDNTFNFTGGPGDGAFDAYSGAKVVFRYNTVYGTDIGWHGNDSSFSGHSGEIYNNTFSTGSPNFAINIRGGTAVIWGNTYSTDYPSSFTLSLYRSCQDIGRDNKMCQGSGNYDENSDASGYRCYQQPGSTGADGLTLWPIIEWDNNHGTGTNNMGFSYNANFVNPRCAQPYDITDHVKEGRDYINHNTCVGVSSAFCTTWWDDVNKKAKNYTPYTYPHPLALSPKKLVLAEKDTFSGGYVWTKSTGKTYTYYLTSKKYDGKENIKRVTENNTSLVKTTSIDLCESTTATGSYFVSPDGTLYVHCTDGSDPDAHTIDVYYSIE